MINPFSEIDWQPSRAKRRQFGRVLAITFSLLATGLRFFTDISAPALAALIAGALAGFLCWAFPKIALPLYVAWHAVGASIGIIISNFLLAVTYFAVLTPIAIMLRLTGRDPLHRKFDRQRVSYWEPAETGVDPMRYYRQF